MKVKNPPLTCQMSGHWPTTFIPGTERQLQLRADMFRKLQLAKESDEYKNLPDTMEALNDWYFSHFAEELRILQREDSEFYNYMVATIFLATITGRLLQRSNNNQ